MEKIPVNHPRKSFFNLTHAKSFTCNPGRLIPICCEEVLPGDKFVIDQALLLRLNPTVTPFMTDLTAYIHYFFVPFRILDSGFEDFITGGDTGDSSSDFPIPTFYNVAVSSSEDVGVVMPTPELGSFWDYLSLPLSSLGRNASPNIYPFLAHLMIYDNYYRDENLQKSVVDRDDSNVSVPSFVNRLYANFAKYDGLDYTWNDLALSFLKSYDDLPELYKDIFSVGWKKDYFTGSLPSTQRGPAATFPLRDLGLEPSLLQMSTNLYVKTSIILRSSDTLTASDTTTLHFSQDIILVVGQGASVFSTATWYQSDSWYSVSNSYLNTYHAVRTSGGVTEDVVVSGLRFKFSVASSLGSHTVHFSVSCRIGETAGGVEYTTQFLFQPEDISSRFVIKESSVNVGNIPSSDYPNSIPNSKPAIAVPGVNPVTIRELRTAWQLQLFLERSNVVGNRYSELLRGHFGVNPRDARLQRPEYIGGLKVPVSVSEVTQTSESGSTPQGHLTGRGLTTDMTRIGKYYSTEFGLIMGYLSILPRASYSQGVPRWLLRRSRYDFYFPEFSHVGDQEVYNAEIFATQSTDSVARNPFGFRGRYDELRSVPDKVCTHFRPDQDLASWTLARYFSQLPYLNDVFVSSTSDPSVGGIPMNRVMMVPSEPAFNVQVGNIIKAYRPVPKFATPGFVDHPYV